jgi:Tfp pilus assembly protein PilF
MRVLVTLLLVLAPAAVWSGDRPADRAEDRLKMGVEAAREGYWQEALMRFEEANRLDPSNAEVLNNMAVAYEAIGRWDDARVAYEQALQLEPGAREIRKNYRQFEEFQESFVKRPKKKGGDANTPEEHGGEEGSDDA